MKPAYTEANIILKVSVNIMMISRYGLRIIQPKHHIQETFLCGSMDVRDVLME